MGVFRRLRDLFSRDAPPPIEPTPRAPVAEEPSPPPPPIAASLAQAVMDARWREVARMLSEGRGAADESERVEAVVSALGPIPDEDTPTTTDAARDDVLLLLAEILVDRGEKRRAADVLARSLAPSALVLRADLFSEGLDGAPTRDDVDRALALLARALMRDIDTPGARDRWERLRARLGRVEESRGPAVGATLVATDAGLPYTLVREIARGGAGVVYEARESIADVQRTIALKLAHMRASTEWAAPPQTAEPSARRAAHAPSLRAQLTHEARIAVRFRGPGVVPILDLDPDAGWLAMAWASGGSLRARLREARVDDPLRDVRRWLRPLVATLAEVHAAGWVHGDVKPANVLFDEAGAPMLGDFGLARECGAPSTPGSQGYVSPERATGAPCSPGDDVYGLGKLVADVVSAGWGDASLRAVAERCTAPSTAGPQDLKQILRDL